MPSTVAQVSRKVENVKMSGLCYLLSMNISYIVNKSEFSHLR